MDFSSAIQTTSAKDVLDLLVLTQYFDTLQDIGQKSKVIFLPDDNHTVRNNMLEAAAR